MVGTTLGVYRIDDEIGRGGMGRVYRGHDTALNRDVAIKVLPASLATDPDRLMRFEREAQALAALNHPNIAHIYGLEKSGDTPAIVMELVEGPTLADRITAGPIPLDEALPIARQIAEALEAAHERGIIHRDLKPANIKVADDGTVKLLDFGLAKAFAPDGSNAAADAMNAPTVTSPAMTQAGVILGTAAYMAPEQAKGKPVDKRVDVWAFGVVLFEMLTGKRPFDGSDVSEVMARVIDREPDWNALPAANPRAIERLLRRCLAKPRKDRLHDIGDARLEIDEVAAGTGEHRGVTDEPQSAAASWKRLMPRAGLLGAAFAAGALVTGLMLWWQPGPLGRQQVLSIELPTDAAIGTEYSPVIVMSPDGRQVVFVGVAADGGQQLYRVDLDGDLVPRPIEGTDDARVPFFSPDGQAIGFVDAGSARPILRTMSFDTGIPNYVCEVPNMLAGASWAPDGTILVAAASEGLLEVPATGGQPTPVTELNRDSDEAGHFWPQVTPDGRFVVFSVLSRGEYRPARFSREDKTFAYVDGVNRGRGARYVPGGGLVWLDGESLYSGSFDLDTGALTSAPRPVLSDVRSWSQSGLPYFAVSEFGDVVYAPGRVVRERRRLLLVGESGQYTPLGNDVRAFSSPQFSPDGTRLAVIVGDQATGGGGDVWIYDLETGVGRPITSSAMDGWPRWTPDGQYVTHSRDYSRVISTPVDTQSPDRPELESYFLPAAWHPDGLQLLLETSSDVLVWRRGETGPGGLLTEDYDEQFVDLSPDGAWLAYESKQGDRGEIYVKRLQGRERPTPISVGREPRWSSDGRRLFFWEDGQSGAGRLRVVSVELQPAVRPYGERQYLSGPYLSTRPAYTTLYDVSPVEDRFVMLEAVEATLTTHLHVVRDWLRR